MAVSQTSTLYVYETNWVVNLFSRFHSNSETSLLKKAKDFTVSWQYTCPIDYWKGGISDQTTLSQASRLCQKICEGDPSTGKTTFGKEMHDTLRPLKEEQSDKVLPSDKECASERLDPNTCQTKMSSLIWSGPYQGLNKEPINHLTRKLSKKLLTL